MDRSKPKPFFSALLETGHFALSPVQSKVRKAAVFDDAYWTYRQGGSKACDFIAICGIEEFIAIITFNYIYLLIIYQSFPSIII